MLQQELLRKIIQTLDDAGIQYMVTGYVASSLQGEPRSTHDIDLVVAIERTDAKKLGVESILQRLQEEAEVI